MLVSLLSSLGVVGAFSSVFVEDFGQVNADWVLVTLMARFLLTTFLNDLFILF